MTSDLGDVVDIVGRFASASNTTLLGRTADGTTVVYKPGAGERPLWDFPAGSLVDREVLTFETDRILGFGVVPETVVGVGPYGRGAVQRFVEADPSFDPLPLVRSGSEQLWPIAVIDLVTNNADRKLGHILAVAGALHAVDHGLTFHPDDKLRTVLWSLAGRAIPARVVPALERLGTEVDGALGDRVQDLLGRRERRAFRHRVDALLAAPVHPEPPTDRPPLPWPPY